MVPTKVCVSFSSVLISTYNGGKNYDNNLVHCTRVMFAAANTFTAKSLSSCFH